MLLSSATLALALPLSLGCRPENTVTAGEARLEVQDSVTFTDVVTGTRATLELSIESGGVGDLILESAALTSDSDTFLSLGPLPTAPLARGQAGVLEISYTPTEVRIGSGTLILESNDPNLPSVEIPITTSAISPELDLSPQTLWFGDVAPGDTEELELSLSAKGQGTLRISHIDASQDDFEWSLPQDTELPLDLLPGTAVTLTVTFSPASLDALDERLVIQSNAAQDPTQSVRLLANTGAEEGPPTAEILAPEWGTYFMSTETVTLLGLAVDQGDAPEDLLVAWYANDGLLGTVTPDESGEVRLETTLPIADQLRLSLRVIDSQGQSDEDSVDLGVFEAGEPTLWRLSGGESTFDFIVADDDVRITLDGSALLDDDDDAKSSHAPLEFQARPGATLRVVATDENYCEKGLSPMVLHWGSAASWELSEAVCNSSCPEDACYDGSYSGPWPNTFVDDAHELPTP
ncbi:MAG: hypothetical protein ACI9VR_001099 [Cognaticolwellia sp.]|jgi:hypothetical protein